MSDGIPANGSPAPWVRFGAIATAFDQVAYKLPKADTCKTWVVLLEADLGSIEAPSELSESSR